VLIRIEKEYKSKIFKYLWHKATNFGYSAAKVVNFVDICKQIRTKLAYSKKYSTFVPLNHPFRQQQYDAND
jgi:hypothetical protein